jgi:hypothetical protein
MYLHEVASDSYVLLQSKWAVGKARELVERLNPTDVIVHRSELTDFYYLYTKSEAIGRLVNHDAQTTLFDAFNLHESTATPTRDAFAAADEVPDRAVVMEEGRVVGFFDATVPLTERGTKRGGGERGPGEVRPVPRSLVTQFTDQVRLAEIVSLPVSLSAEPAQGSALPVALPVSSAIDVVVVPKGGLALEGKGEGTLVVSDEQETLPLQFKLRATELGPAKLQVLAFHHGQPLGAITGGFRAPDPNRSAVLLENGEELTPEDLGGVVRNLGLARPLVFLNACQIGRSALSLTDIGGRAAQFLRAGAAVFIGAYWSVYDQAAHDFARAFYIRLLAGSSVGQAAKEARAAIKPLGNPTWLAYTVFADPLATVE